MVRLDERGTACETSSSRLMQEQLDLALALASHQDLVRIHTRKRGHEAEQSYMQRSLTLSQIEQLAKRSCIPDDGTSSVAGGEGLERESRIQQSVGLLRCL